MVPIRLASIAGFNTSRGSMFQGSATDAFGLGSRGSSLGRNAQEWYNEAKEEVKEYDDLMVRATKIANQNVRESIVKRYGGDPTDSNSARYRRDSVAYNISQAEGYTPVNYLIFDKGDVIGRVDKLKEWNSSFKTDVESAERTYGSLPAPQIVERVTTIGQVPGWVTPVVVGALGVAALAAFGVFGD